MLSHFNPREQRMLALVARGFRLKEVAYQMDTNSNTMRVHLENMYDREGFTGLAHAVAVFAEWRQLRRQRGPGTESIDDSGPVG